MQIMSLLPHPKAECVETDPIMKQFIYKTKNGIWDIVADLHSSNKLLIAKEGKHIGLIVSASFSSPRFGSIWVSVDNSQGRLESECIGEYFFKESQYFVLPYEDSRKCPDKIEEIHPLDYFIRFIEQKS
jgi:hypothetical protein